jgi:two-component system cell cycle response regulator
MATRDPVTGIANRYMLMQQLEALFEVTPKAGQLALLFIDVDRFKSINDRLGHNTGDSVLALIAQKLEAALRPADVVGRYGGDEFLVGLPGCTAQDAAVIAERIRLSIGEEPGIVDGGEPVRISISIGVAGIENGAADLATLIGMADEAVYRAKAEGRNRVQKVRAV